MLKLLFLIFLLNVSKLKAANDNDQTKHEFNCTSNKDESMMMDPWINNMDKDGKFYFNI